MEYLFFCLLQFEKVRFLVLFVFCMYQVCLFKDFVEDFGYFIFGLWYIEKFVVVDFFFKIIKVDICVVWFDISIFVKDFLKEECDNEEINYVIIEEELYDVLVVIYEQGVFRS